MSEFADSGKAGGIPLQPLPQDVKGKLSQAQKYKEEGTDHFKAGNFKKAISSYAKVTAFTRGLPGSKRGLSGIGEMAGSGASVKPIDVTEESMAIELESVALTNIAMCYLKLGEPRQTLEFCKRALATNPTAWKAVLRKSEAQTMMGNYEVSKSTLAEALKLAPDAAAKSAVKKELERVIATDREATQISNIKQKKAFGKMFSSETTPAATSSAASDKLDETVSSESTNT